MAPSVFILGLVVASVTAPDLSTLVYNISSVANNMMTTAPSDAFDASTASSSASDPIPTSAMTPNSNSTVKASPTTEQNGSTTKLTTPSPKATSARTSTTKMKFVPKGKAPTSEPVSNNDKTGIIILIVIILVALGCGAACYLARKSGRRYSVDFNSRIDEANIPLSSMEPERPVDTLSHNGLKTFESAEAASKEPQKLDAQSEAQVEQKAKVDSGAESAAPAPLAGSSKDKPKEDDFNQGPPALEDLNLEEKTDDEGVDSIKTSVESLKEANDNNSNNNSEQTDLRSGSFFWDIPLDLPV